MMENGNLVKMTKEDLELNKKHLEERKPFKIYYEGDDLGIECDCYNSKDGYYHGIKKNNNGEYEVWGRIDIQTILRAIVDENFWIKVKRVNLKNDKNMI